MGKHAREEQYSPPLTPFKGSGPQGSDEAFIDSLAVSDFETVPELGMG